MELNFNSIPSSKSLFNRALIVQSFFPKLKVLGQSDAKDVVQMQAAVSKLLQGQHQFEAGDAGTILRFLAVRLSREARDFEINGSERLFSRPQEELKSIFQQLGVSAEIKANRLYLHSQGWDFSKLENDFLEIRRDSSSQFASAFLLSAWNLPQELKIRLRGTAVSDSYLQMTIRLLKSFGMQIQEQENILNIPARQTLKTSSYEVEPDLSSLFAFVAAQGVSKGSIHFPFPSQSLQPDAEFLNLLKKMGAEVESQVEGSFLIKGFSSLQSVDVNLSEQPDLFPVLGVLLGLASGTSQIFGAPHLKFKESNRIQKTQELLQKMAIQSKATDDGLQIFGQGFAQPRTEFDFSSDHDHRMAMAAGVAAAAGFRVHLQDSQTVDKSYPQFWQAIGVQP